MTRFKAKGRKIISVLLCVTMLMSFLPAYVATAISEAAIDSRSVDVNTWDEWKLLFGPDHPTTENAGAVWTDKSVFTPDNLPKEYTDANGTLADTGDNFLVALSAIASNKEIVGYSTIPTDTILVLDVSGSMNSGNPTKASQMVTAANNAIRDLLALNYHNRIGVVLYSGNSSAGASTYAQGTVLCMPLDRYEIKVSGNNSDQGYLYLDGTTVKVRNNVYNSQNKNDFDKSKSVVGGTYIQAGLDMAMDQFKSVPKADTVIEDGVIQGGTKRMPITVLMSDGAPTTATTNYTNVGTSNVGNGIDTYCATDEVGFLTQLTAAYVKSEIEAWYETDSLFYTLGVGVGNSAVAKAVLDPANANDGSETYWAAYLNLANNGRLNLTVPQAVAGNSQGNPGTKTVSITKNAVITRENYIYTDKHFTAESTGLAAGFQDIVNEIYIQSRYYPTSLEGGNPDFSGYIDFQDIIGEYMDVKDIKGVLLNGKLYTGAMLLEKIFANIRNGSLDLDDATVGEFVHSVMSRLGLDQAAALKLINDALSAGQFAYNSSTGEFSNYIGWYAYADTTFAGFWDEGKTNPDDYGIDTNNDGKKDKFPVYAVKSYGMLGQATGSIKDSDMMFMTIRVVKNIETGEEILDWKIPAALVPMVTYSVAVEGNVIDDNTKITDVTISESTPVRLIYEVGLDPEINEYNVADITDEKHIDADGNRVFWSNYFDISAPEHEDHIVTYAEFTPNEDNERYYYVDIAPIYDADGAQSPITTAPQSGKTYYTKQFIFSKNADKPVVYYELIADNDISSAEYNSTLGCYVIPGHVYNHPNPIELHKEKADKTLTDSAHLYYYPEIVATNASYVVSTHHGNNGRLTVKPAQGIAISKTIDIVEVGASDQFKFKISMIAPEGATLLSEYDSMLTEIGETEGTKGKVQVNNGVIEVDLKADQTIYITGLPEGTVYTVEEISNNNDYMVKSVHVNGTAMTGTAAMGVVTKSVIDDVDFLNTPTSEGELVIVKEVTHPFTTTPDALANKVFTVEVSLTNGDVNNKTFELVRANGTSSVTTDANGKFTVTLKNGESVAVKGIPADSKYTVSEPLATMPDGFTLDVQNSANLSGTIPADANIQATVVNNYTYSSVNTDIDVDVVKNFSGRDWLDGDKFTFEIYKVNDGNVGNTLLKSFELTKNNTSYTYTLVDTLTDTGTYYYSVREIAGNDKIGITYDTVDRMFRVTVTDNDMDGRLEVSKVENISKTTVSGDASNGYTVVADDFVNTYAPTGSTQVEINVNKEMFGGEFQLNGFKFGLYTETLDENGQPTGGLELYAESSLTDAAGKASFKLNYTAESVGKTYKYYLKEINTGISGMQYDTATYIVNIEIKDNLDGTISAVKSYEKFIAESDTIDVNSISFTNMYYPEKGELVLSGLKVLENRVQYAGEFEFELYETDSTYNVDGLTPIETVSNNFDGGFSFSLLTYSAEGKHYYVVKEVNTGVAGVTYDTTVYKIEVSVEQDGTHYVSKVTSVNGSATDTDIVFTNTYNAQPVEITLSGNKVLTGRDINEGEFVFELYETDSTFSTVGKTTAQQKKNAANTFKFDSIEFDEEGVYYFVVKEQVGSLGGVAYDTGAYNITVVVTDNGRGQLVQTTTMTRDGQAATGMVFRNHYTPKHTYIDIDGAKLLNGREMVEGEFEFKLINALNGALVATTTNKADGSFKFENVHITSAGTHHGKIVEVALAAGGVSYDTRVYGLILEIEDDLNGNLVEVDRRVWLEGRELNPDLPIEFHNYYKATEEIVSLGGTKNINGRPLNAGEFIFSLYETDSTYDLNNATLHSQVVNAADGKFDFGGIIINTDEDRYFVIVEEAVNPLGGVTYDENVYKVKIEVTDNLEGKYIINTSVILNNNAVDVDDIVFNNTYKAADTTLTLDGVKTIEGRPLNANEFKFKLYKTDSTFNLNSASLVETVKNAADGKFEFSAIDITSDEDLYFVIVEDATDNLGGVQYDERTYQVIVTVNDLYNGQYEVITSISQDGNYAPSVVFNNKYKAANTSVTFNGVKTLSGRGLNADEFSFTLYKTDANYNLNTAEYIQNVWNDANGKFEFSAVDIISDEDLYFIIVEDAGNVGGVTYDEKVYKVKVEVTDLYNGQYDVKTVVSVGDTAVSGDIVFSNSYKAADTSIIFDGNKTLNGRTLKDGEFSFRLYETDSSYSYDETKLIETVKNGADGKFSFKAIDITSAGERYFVVVEESGDAEGVDYDNTVYKVTVSVTDNGNGKYDVDTVITAGNETKQDMIFVNVFTPKDISVAINVQKLLTNTSGREMGLDGFDFNLVGEGKNLFAKSDKDGKAGFSLVFTADDIGETFSYKLSEVKGDIKGMTYSNIVYEISITVEVDGNGVLKAICNGDPTPVDVVDFEFTNVYEGDPDIPVTGDTANPFVWFAMFTVALIGLGAVLTITARAKKSEE